MQTLHAFGEVGYTLLAIASPLVLIVLAFFCHKEIHSSERETKQLARGSDNPITPIFVYAGGGMWLTILSLAQIVLLLLFVLNILLVTVPYGASHGLW